MKYSVKVISCGLLSMLVSCNFKPCEKVTDKDITGYYIPCNSEDKGSQYINILEDNTYIAGYCNGDSIIEEKGIWQRSDGCHILLMITGYFEAQKITPYDGSFIWVRGKLSRGEDYWSFQKVRRKPELTCGK